MKWLIVLCFLSGLDANAQTGWNLKIDKSGVKVYNHKSDSSRFSEIRVDVTYPAHLSDLAAVLYDVPHHKDWSYATKSGYLLKRLSESEILFYKLISTPPPLANRDFVGSLSITQDPATRVMTVKVKAVGGYLPEKKDLVRVHATVETWTVTPMPNDQIRIEYYLKVDPGGSVSPFLVNMFATKAPYETFRNLKNALLLRKSKPSKFTFIKD